MTYQSEGKERISRLQVSWEQVMPLGGGFFPIMFSDIIPRCIKSTRWRFVWGWRIIGT